MFRHNGGFAAALFAVVGVVVAGCGGPVAGKAMPQQGDASPPMTTEGTPGGDTAPPEDSSPATTDVTSAGDLREVDDSTDIDPCSLMPTEELARGGDFSEPEVIKGSCWSTEDSTGAQVSIEFSRDTLDNLIQRAGLELGNIHGRAAVEFDMSSQDLGCQVIMEMNPEEVVMVLFDGPPPECQYAATVATAVETRISQG